MIKNGVLLYLLIVIGCGEPNSDYGFWYASGGGNGLGVSTIEFTYDSIRILDNYGFLQNGSYELETDRRINYSLTNNPTRESFELTHLSADSLVVRDGFVFYKGNYSIDERSDERIEEFKLLGLKTKKILDAKMRVRSLHYFRNRRGELILRGDHGGITDYNDILLALEVHHARSGSRPVIFLGESVTLRELKELYDYISLSDYRVWIVTEKEGLYKYHVVEDRIELWGDERIKIYEEKINGPKPPPPPLSAEGERNSRNYLAGGAIEIRVGSVMDTILIDNIQINTKYLIVIDCEVKMRDYMAVRQKTLALKNKNIKTEIEF